MPEVVTYIIDCSYNSNSICNGYPYFNMAIQELGYTNRWYVFEVAL